MAWYSRVLGLGIDKIIETTGKVIDAVHTSDDEKSKNEIVKMQIQLEALRARDEIEAQIEKEYISDLENLRKQITVELQSEDWFVRRSRPTFNYVFYVIIAFNYIVLPLYQLVTGVGVAPVELPSELWVVFGVGFCGYAYLRSKYDKQNISNGK